MLCNYGCGLKANYQFKNGKWCCSKSHNSCPSRKHQISENRKGEKHPLYGKMGYWKNKKRPDHSKNMKGSSHPLFGKTRSRKTKKKIGNANKITILKIKERYPLFSQIEEMRYNPNKPKEKEIQVHCKNHNCPNSKEQDGWFTPTKGQFSHRIYSLEQPSGFGESNFYCSEECKTTCVLFRLRSDPFKKTKEYYTQQEYETFRQYVLKRDNYKCQYCENKATIVHHERAQKLEPFFALDPDFAWSCCKECHYKYGHKTGTECSTGNLAAKLC